MKYSILRKKLIKLGIICGVIVLALGVIYYLIISYSSDKEEELGTLKSKLNGSNTQFSQMQKKLGEYRTASDFYKQFTESGNADAQNFRRDYAKNLLGRLNEQVGLVDLKFNMEQFQKMGGSFETKTVSMFSSKVTVQYTANSDIDCYNFIKSIVNTFPGSVFVDSYSVKATKEINIELLTQIANGSSPLGLVSGEIIFDWRGIQDNPVTAKEAQKPLNLQNPVAIKGPITPPPGGAPNG